MSSSNDLFGPEDFENLIAAVDSLDIPSDEEIPSFPHLQNTSRSATKHAVEDISEDALTFEVEGEPFDSNHVTLALDDDDFSELDNLAADFTELNFEDAPEASSAFSPSATFAPQTKVTATAKPSLSAVSSAAKPVKATDKTARFAVDDPFKGAEPIKNFAQNTSKPVDDEDELIDMYASFLEDTVEPVPNDSTLLHMELEDHPETSTSDDEFAELAGLSLDQPVPAATVNYFAVDGQDDESEVFDGVAAANEIYSLLSDDDKFQPATVLQKESAAPQPLKVSMAKTQLAAEKLKAHLASISTNKNSITVSNDKDKAQIHAVPGVEKAQNIVQLEPDDEFADIASQSSSFAEEPVVLPSRKTVELNDNLMSAFVESALRSKQQPRVFSIQYFALKFPKLYFSCTIVLALVGFVYILAIPATLVFTMFNGFEMLNSPFTNSVVMLLLALFSVSLFLFMVCYKLFDLKFVGPGGITLNNENADLLIDKIQQLKAELAIPKIHEVVLTRRHELNLIKLPRFGLPFWSRNVLAIGYPLLQTLPPEYFNVALARRLLQFNKRKNMLHNWLGFMRRTWTIYAVSLKTRKGVLDLFHYCFFAPYASLYRTFSVYVSQRDEIYADEKALHHCNDRDLIKTAQTIRITQAMLVQYFWPKLNENLQSNTAAPHYVKPYRKLPETLHMLLESKNVDAWFIRLGQEEMNPGDAEAPFALRMNALGQRKVAIPDAFDTNAAQHYFGDQYDKMTDLLDNLWAEDVQKELFEKNIHSGSIDTQLPCHLAIEPA